MQGVREVCEISVDAQPEEICILVVRILSVVPSEEFVLVTEGVYVQLKAESMGDFDEITMRHDGSCCLVDQG